MLVPSALPWFERASATCQASAMIHHEGTKDTKHNEEKKQQEEFVVDSDVR